MMSKKMTYIVVAAVAAIVVYLAFKQEINPFFRKLFNRKNGMNAGQGPSIQQPAPGNMTPAQLNYNKVLKKGSQGPEVTMLQEMLLQQGAALPQFGADGIFGDETKSALQSITGKSQISLAEFQAFLQFPPVAPTPPTVAPRVDATNLNIGYSLAN